jgi:Flp pilus assembly protein TadD
MYHSHHIGTALHFTLKVVNMRLDPKAILAVWPLAAAAIFFAFSGGSFAQEAHQVDARADDAAVDTADLPLLLSARLDLNNGMVEQADREVRQYLGKHPNSADAHYMLGFVLFREIQERAKDQSKGQSNFKADTAKASLAEYTEGAKYRTPSYLDLKIVALDYILLEDYADADKWLSRSLEWNPQDAESWYDLGRIKYNEARLSEALNAFDRCLKLDSANVKAEDNLGMTYAKLGRTSDAISAFQTAIAWQAGLREKNPQPFIDLGRLLIDQNRPQEATSYLLQATKIAPGSDQAHELLDKARSLAKGSQK